MRRLHRPRLSPRRTFSVALILFAMLCGLTLVVARHPQMPFDHAERIERALKGTLEFNRVRMNIGVGPRDR